MQKKITILLLVLLTLTLTVSALYVEDATSPPEEEPDLGELVVEPTYDPDTDYMSLMVRCATRNDMAALVEAVQARNEKISWEGLEQEPLSAAEFLANFEAYAGFDRNVDYLAQMTDCCLSGDVEGGIEAARKRNLKIDASGSDEVKIDFMDLFLVSKIIYAEGGSNWLDEGWKMRIGEVVFNRVASPEFPNTFYEVIKQPGQYSPANKQYFENLLPSEMCVLCAIRLFQGERLMEPAVVFQANFTQGSGIYLAMYDDILGYTYFCYSNRMYLYE